MSAAGFSLLYYARSYTFGEMDCSPIGEALYQVDIFVLSLGQTDLWSDGSPSVVISCGQVCSYFSHVDLCNL